MKESPNIASVASLIGDPGRANMLSALMGGKALTASELASEGGVSLQTASGHLARMEQGGLVTRTRQGRHHYFRLASEDVAHVLEALMGLAAKQGGLRIRTGPKDADLRRARVCYKHLAGEMGVLIYDSLRKRNLLREGASGLEITDDGLSFFEGLGMDISALHRARAPICKECLDWSARRPHLAGALGRALLKHFLDAGWASRVECSRVILFSPVGNAALKKKFLIGD